MPNIRTVDHAKAFLGLIFKAAGINDVEIEARRLAPDRVVRIGAEKPSAPKSFVKEVGGVKFGKLSIAEVYENAENDRILGNYLYLVPSRMLLKDEWEKIMPVVQQIALNEKLYFNCSFRITCEDGRVCETGQDLTEDGRRQHPVFGHHSKPPKRTYF